MNSSSLQVGKVVYQILSDNGIKQIYPLVVDIPEGQSIDFPFIVYRRAGLTPSDTKDVYNVQETVSIEITVASDKYEESITLAQTIKDILDKKRGSYGGLQIRSINLYDASEDFIDDTFIQTLTFNITIQ